MTLPDEFRKMFPPMTPELEGLLTELDGTPDDIAQLVGQVTQVQLDLGALADQTRRLAEHVVTIATRVTALESANPPPDPEPDIDTVHVGAAIKTSTLNICWTVIQDTDLGAATKEIVDKCSHGKNMHLGPGFGPSSPLQEFEGGPIDFSYHDKIYGAPGSTGGYFGNDCLRILTAFDCPPYMRQPRTPGLAPNPTALPTMGLYDQVPPHWSQHDNYAKFVAAFVDRYKIDVLQDRNEFKGESIGATAPAGAVWVPPDSGLPLAPGSKFNRWAMELHTDRWNKIVTHVGAVRPECKLAMGYIVARTYLDPNLTDSANDVFPYNLNGAWGFADKKAMAPMMYMVENALGWDYICLDVKTSANNTVGIPGGITPENQWSGLQKVLDWEQWFNDLADWNPIKYGRAKDCETWWAEAYSRLPEGLDASNHAEACATDAWSITKYIHRSRAAGWVRWQTEGNRGATDSASAHSISLVHAKGSAKSLQPTEAVPVYAGLVEHFKPGTQLYSVTVGGDSFPVSGIASDKILCLVSKAADPINLTFKGEPLVLAPYDVKFVAR